MGNRELFHTIDNGVNSKSHTFLEYFTFHGIKVDDAQYLLKWPAWDSFKFQKATPAFGCSFLKSCVFNARSYYLVQCIASLWCDMCNFSNHDISLHPYYVCYV